MTRSSRLAEEADEQIFSRLWTEVNEAKEELYERIERVMRVQGLTRSQLARAIGMDRSDVTRLLRGDFDRFSLERLVRALRDLGAPVRIVWVDVEGEQSGRPGDASWLS